MRHTSFFPKKNTLALAALCCCALFTTAQNLTKGWEKIFPNTGEKTFRTLIEGTNGYLVAVGESKGNGLLIITDHSTGQIMAETRISSAKRAALWAAAQTFEGHFLLAGTTASGKQGGDDAWLLEVDENGKKISETTFGTPGDDECRQIALLPDGSALLAGYRDGQKNGDIWLFKVEKKDAAWTMAWEKNLGSEEFKTLSGLVTTTDGGAVFCGNTAKKAENGSNDVYLAKADAKGNLLWKKFFGGEKLDEVFALTADRDGGFALAGLTHSKGAGNSDCWLIKTSRDGFRQWDKTFGGADEDFANALVQTDDGGYLLAGATKSHRRSTRQYAAYLAKVSPGGDLQWEKPMGGDREDAFTAARVLHDGSFAVAGITDGNNGWMLHLSDPYARNLLADSREAITAIHASEPVLRTADGTLTPGQSAWVSVQISNNTDADLPDLRVAADNRTGGTDLRFWPTNYCGRLRKGETAEMRIPLRAEATAADGQMQLAFTVSSGAKSLKSLEKTITLRRPKSAALILAGHTFDASASSDKVTLNVTVENTGDSTSRPAELTFACPAGVTPSSATTQPLGVITAHSRREVQLVFIKTQQFSAAQPARFGCTVRAGGREHIRKTLEWQPGGKTSMVASGPMMIWQDPAPHETGSNKVTSTKDHIDLKMTIVSPKQVHTKNIKIRVNGVEMDGSKFNEEDLSMPQKEEARFVQTYRNKLPLKLGRNRVQVLVDGTPSDELDIEFSPERANLHVVAIGPRHEDLQYTAKDAADFAKTFAGQGGAGKLFEQVSLKTLVAPEQTDMTAIKQTMFDLAYQWTDGQIKPNDVLVLFISSHGKIVENRFKILQTGYNPKYDRLTVDYKTDILEVLSPLNCKKLVFLDACHSGGAKEGFGGVSKAVVELAQTQPGVSTLTSCGSTEKSYEDKTWENGAFTEALLEAFGNTACTDASGQFRADTDGDGIIRLGELYDFLRRRVPAMVKNAVPNAPTSQTPFMPESQLDKGLPIFLLEKK